MRGAVFQGPTCATAGAHANLRTDMSPLRPLADVARFFENLRISQDWSRARLAEEAGVPVEVIAGYETNPESLTSKIAVRILSAVSPLMVGAALFQESSSLESTPLPRWLLDEMAARMHEYEAALRIDQHRFWDALQCIEKGLAISPCPERTGRLLLTRSAVCVELGRAQWAIEALTSAESHLDLEEEPDLWLRIRLEQLHLLCEAGKYQDAKPYLPEVHALANAIGTERQKRMILPLRGRIAAGLGQEAEAMACLAIAHAELWAADELFEATAVDLDLAAVFSRDGLPDLIPDLAEQLEPLLRERRLPRAARSTLKTFFWCFRRGTLTTERCSSLATDFRMTRSRITHPYELPI